jgi:outer membrane cobalamin receptor
MKLGASPDETGRFVIAGVPPGTYTLAVTCIGYRKREITDVVVSTGHPTQVQVALEEETVAGEEVVVTASQFSQPQEIVTSSYTLGYEEVRRAPGAIGDVSRMVQSMPGVVATNDQRNDLVVRGGSPSENITIVDNVDVPNLSHFGTQGSTGGPISMLNTEFIREADFLAGGFPAQYGGKLSSVLNISLREGNREGLSGIADLGIAGAGMILEGSLGEKGNWMAAARRSYLDLIAGGFGLTAIPVYSNYQAKAVYEVDPSNKLWLVALGGKDDIEFAYDPEEIEEPVRENVTSGGWRTVTGVNWQMLWGSGGYGVLGVADAVSAYRQEARDVDLGNIVVFENDSHERMTTVKYDAFLAMGATTRVGAGAAVRLRNDRYRIAQPVGVQSVWTTDSTRSDPLDVDTDDGYTDGELYAQVTVSPLSALTLTAGVRYDRFGYSDGASAVSPRIGASYALTPQWDVSASGGRFAQAPPSVYVRSVPGNESLTPILGTHFVLGTAWYPAPDLKVSVEGYAKTYEDYPVSTQYPFLSLANSGDQYSVSGMLIPMVSSGTGWSRGVEFYLQKRLTGHLYGQVSYSYSRTRHAALDGVERPGSFDIPHVLSLVGGYRLNDTWEFSAKFTYSSGRPTTPLDLEASQAQNRTIYDAARINAERIPDYHRLDVRGDYRAHFDGWNLVAYLELQNVYNRENVFMYTWNEKTGEPYVVNQIAFFPVGGVKIEF